MRVVVAGATGRIGRHLVVAVRAAGHQVVPAALSTGTDVLSGVGLDAVLDGADVVVDATNSPRSDEAAATRFFLTGTGRLLQAGARAGVRHHVLVSNVGVDRAPGLGYMQAKLLQEEAVEVGPVPYTIVRSTHSYDFCTTLMELCTAGGVLRLPPLQLQALTLPDLATVLTEIAGSPPLNAGCEVAGPDVAGFDEIATAIAAHAGGGLLVRSDASVRPFFGSEVGHRALLPGPSARLTATGLAGWLGVS
jgi:uncharacterized protein YbjT (DUF2867 family)